ncbi:DUF1028 domain-containing protein [Reyranella sp.]|uniref:DUF1028 domain-containing protein n=1 Tax=Reyranella sp. TaxID=1929291 RepID=UPI003BAD772A
MTYTILGRCAKTGRLGIGIATYSVTVGRYAHSTRSKAGVTVSQANANENNNAIALRLLAQGLGAQAVLEQLKANDAYHSYRQIGVIDRGGAVAAYTGANVRGWAGEVTGDNYISTGNGLRGRHVAEAIAEGFLAEPEADLEHRLLMALEYGRDAGGQGNATAHRTERSAALQVSSRHIHPDIDLRVDLHDKAVDELRRVWTVYKQYEGYYADRGRNPRGAIGQEAFMASMKEPGP